MALITELSTCAICHEALVRPYTSTSGLPFISPYSFERFHDAPLHFDCLSGWKHREEFSRELFVNALAGYWSGYGALLDVTPDWFLACGPADPGRDPAFAEVRLATWPSCLYTAWSHWEVYINGGFLRGLAGPPLDVANAVMAQVRRKAPTLEALQALRPESCERLGEERSLVEFGSYLATLWGERAYRTDWQLMEQQRRADRQASRERERLHREAITQSNVLARDLAAELARTGHLRCPHCRRWTREMRFIDLGWEAQSYFICGRCGRSFAGSEASDDGSGEPWDTPAADAPSGYARRTARSLSYSVPNA